jgi:thiopeptide-type bacteriocin biosynthesis protein
MGRIPRDENRLMKVPPLEPSGFFVLRTPALPFATLTDWVAGCEGDSGARDELRRRLRELLIRPEIDAALWVASPDVHAALRERSDRAEAAAIRYVTRMASRATPFGLFAGCSIGRIGERTNLTTAPPSQWRRHTRLDADYLDALIRALLARPAVRERVMLRPNDSLHEVAGRMRFVEARQRNEVRTHHLVEIDADDHLHRALARAAGGANLLQVAEAVAAGGVPADVAASYGERLLDAQVLVPDLAVQVTGDPPLDALIADVEALGEVGARAGAVLRRVRHELSALDEEGIAAPPERHLALARVVEVLPAAVRMNRLLQVDLTKPAPDATLAQDAAAELARSADLLARIAPPPRPTALDDFRERFRERYEAREVPLFEALDEELGVGFSASEADPSPLLAGLSLSEEAIAEQPFGPREERLLAFLQRGAPEIVLTPDDLDALSAAEPRPLPDALAVVATVTSCGLVAPSASGPSGARLLGRFCHADPEFANTVREHLRAEEALDPDAIFAEVVHLPAGRLANILIRPLLRDAELEWLGRSGAPERIAAADLLVSVRANEVVLSEAESGRRVVPRLTTAHAFHSHTSGLYRFLCALQGQGRAESLAWSWAPFESALVHPRVRWGRTVLARARWRATRDELKALRDWDAVQAWRQRRGLPRWIVLRDGDNKLPVDLENVLSAEAFARQVRALDHIEIEERIGEGDTAEVVVPFVRRAPLPSAGTPAQRPRRVAFRRVFAPGSEWTYLKLYTGTATADRLLREEIAPLASQLEHDGWFFLRYADPGFHLRVRFRGDPAVIRPPVEALAARALEAGLVSDAVLGTYVRELERYGGPAGIVAAERIFELDSNAVIELLTRLEPGDAGFDERWRLGLLGAERLLRDLGLDDSARARVCQVARDRFAREHRTGAAGRKALGARFRVERDALAALLDVQAGDDHPLAPGVAVLEERSARIRPIVEALDPQELWLSAEQLAVPYVHMYLNRLLRSANQAHEHVIYDLLARLLERRAARARVR